MNDTKIPTHGTASELINTHAERLAHEEYERAQKRRLELADQRSDLNPPEVRIRTWKECMRCACQAIQAIRSSRSSRPARV